MSVRIKRYANRKLYNTETSRYITLRGISDLLQQGHGIEVVDNETGDDISSLVLSQILVDDQKKQKGAPALPPGDVRETAAPILGELLQHHLMALYTLLRRRVGDVQENLQENWTGVRDNVRRWIHTPSDGLQAPEQSSPDSPDRELDPLEGAVMAAVQAALERADLPTRNDLARLESQLDALRRGLEARSPEQ